MSDFNAIVVGGGLAGLTAARLMARAGLEVLLVERGNYCGAKNMTGGRIYTHTLETAFPGITGVAPLERKIVQERFTRFAGSGTKTAAYRADALGGSFGPSYAVLRAVFDRWLAERAEEEGVAMVCGVRVDELILRDGRVCGILSDGDELESDVVLLADGVNAQLAQKAGLRGELTPEETLVGVKELVELGSDLIEARFGLNPGEGLAWSLPGCLGAAPLCDGFLYTNRDSVSVGLNLPLSLVADAAAAVPQMLEDFRRSQVIAPLLEGGRLGEYSAHLIPRYDPERLPGRWGPGVLAVGDAAGLCADFGFTLHGMDLAVESGRLAAQTVIVAAASGFGAEALSAYDGALKESVIFSCLNKARSCREAAAQVGAGAAEFEIALNGKEGMSCV